MSFTVFLGNLPTWVTADDIRGWLAAENLVADAIKVIRNPETQESKGFAFIEAPNTEEMNSIIRRFDRAPLEDRLLRANPAQPPKPKGQVRPMGSVSSPVPHAAPQQHAVVSAPAPHVAVDQRPPRRGKNKPGGGKKSGNGGSSSAFAEELAKAL
jgi:RNA recognition motif-containing protein